MPTDVPLVTNALVLVALLVVSTVGWLVLRRRDGSFRAAGTSGAEGSRADEDTDRLVPSDLGLPHTSWGEAVAAGSVGPRGTFVQVSSAGCATCPQVARMLAGLATEGVQHVEVDAAERLDLVRRLGIMRTPTVLLVDGSGALVSRTSGTVRREQAVAALARLTTTRDDAPAVTARSTADGDARDRAADDAARDRAVDGRGTLVTTGDVR